MNYMRAYASSLMKLLCIVLLGPAPVCAQTLYRCGNTYQDKPCVGEPGRVVLEDANSFSRGKSSSSRAPDEYCAEQGAAARQLRWEKEAGRTQADQIKRDADNAAFIRYVYAKRGSALDVLHAVEADCMKTRDNPGQHSVASSASAERNTGFVPVAPRKEATPPAEASVPRRGGEMPIEQPKEQSRNVDQVLCKSLADAEATTRNRPKDPADKSGGADNEKRIRDLRKAQIDAGC